jgi:MOSC domain-containing protein YiiM
MHAVLDRDAAGELVRLSGVMAVVRTGGTVRAGDAIEVAVPPVRPSRWSRSDRGPRPAWPRAGETGQEIPSSP